MFESKVIGMAPSERLGVMRVIVVLCALTNIVFQNFDLLAQSVGPWYPLHKISGIIPPAGINIFFNSTLALLIFKAITILFLISALLGFRTKISLFFSSAFYFLYLATLGVNSWTLDNGILPLYLMFMMIWIPSGEGFSLDQKWQRDYAHLKLDDRPSISIGWSIFLIRTVLAFSYFQSGISKLHNTGLSWIRPWRLQQFMLEDGLIFSHTGLVHHLIAIPQVFWIALACGYLALELFFPILLISRRLRIPYLLLTVIFRSVVLIPQGIFFHDLILLQFLFYDWDRILSSKEISPYDRRAKRSGFKKD